MDSSDMPVYRWFESDGLYMAIDQSSGNSLLESGMSQENMCDVTDLSDALLLADHDPLLQCLDSWSDHVFDWKPVHGIGAENSGDDIAGADSKERTDSVRAATPLHQQTHLPKLTVTLASLEGQKRTVYLAILHAELIQMPDLPIQWQPLVNLIPHAQLYDITLQETTLSVQEHQKVMPGAFILLPDSFADAWTIDLQASAGGTTTNSVDLPLRAQLRPDSNTIRLFEHEISVSDTEQELLEPNVDLHCVLQERIHANDTSIRIMLKTPVLVNRLYAKSAWLSEHNVLIALPEKLEGAVVEIHGATGAASPLQGIIKSLGLGCGVLLNDMKTTSDSNKD